MCTLRSENIPIKLRRWGLLVFAFARSSIKFITSRCWSGVKDWIFSMTDSATLILTLLKIKPMLTLARNRFQGEQLYLMRHRNPRTQSHRSSVAIGVHADSPVTFA